jgi:3-oxoacyl-[acyl-carrier-protein] synthase-3
LVSQQEDYQFELGVKKNMEIIKLSGVRIDAIYACLPDNVYDNEKEGEKLFGEKTKDIVKSIGIKYRCVANEGISSLDLCCKSAAGLMRDGSINRNKIGAILFVTFSPEYLMPNNAIGAQHRLGLSSDIIAFDINMACSGYPYGLWLAGLIARLINKSVLLLDGDVQTAYTSKMDKSTTLLFADAGTATLISPVQNDEDWYFAFYSDGSRRKVLYIPVGGSLNRIQHDDLDYKETEDGSIRRNIDIVMDGLEIFRFVVQDAAKFIADFLCAVQKRPEEIEAFIPHQANIYMIKKLTKRLGINEERLCISGDKYGNSSSATIPVTIADYFENKPIKSDLKNVLISGFGGGLSIGTALISLKRDALFKLFFYR